MSLPPISAAELEQYLHEHIPLSRAMQVSVLEVGAMSVTLAAPLAPNINHRHTVFGGSAASVATLAAWSVLHRALCQEGLDTRVVIQKSSMDYEKPIAGDFVAAATIDDQESWGRFLRAVARRGRGRIRLNAELAYGGERVGTLQGDFVAFKVD
jgi:thioesterase domain-containing protein